MNLSKFDTASSQTIILPRARWGLSCWVMALILSVMLGLSSRPVAAQGIIIVPRPIPPTPERPIAPPVVELTQTAITATITDGTARTAVFQRFHNHGGVVAEGDYYFPVPKGAQVTDFALTANGKTLRGEVLERDKAREIYQSIVQKMRDPGLLEWMDSDLFRVRVFPIPASGDVDVNLEYVQILPMDQGIWAYTLPARPSSLRGRMGADARPSSVRVQFQAVVESRTKLRGASSPTHPIRIASQNDKRIVLEADGGLDAAAGDFQLNVDTARESLSAQLVTTRRAGQPGFFLMRISPPDEAQTSEPLHVTFVLDTSGSMMDDNKLGQAQRALSYCLTQLRPQDTFRLLTFSTDVSKFRSGEIINATQENVADAKRFVSELVARGSTNIHDALIEATVRSEKIPATVRRTIIFITDGQPTVSETRPEKILEKVAASLDDKTRLFTFGVGVDVNAKLLDELAERSRSAADYILPKQDTEVVLGRFFDKVSRPALTDVSLECLPDVVSDRYPKKLPDVFTGVPLTIVGRFNKAQDINIVLKGSRNGKPAEFKFEKTLPENESENRYVEKLWATRKVAYLLDEIRLRGETSETRKEVEELARTYQIVTPYTSFLAQEDESPVTAGTPVLRQRMMASTRTGRGTATSADAPASRAVRFYASDGADKSNATGSMMNLSEQAGAGAVAASQQLARMKKAESVSESSDSQRSLAEASVAGRQFRKDGEKWIEAGLSGGETVVSVKVFSPLYFEILAKRPEWKEILALGQNVTFRVSEKVVLKVGSEGLEQKSDMPPAAQVSIFQ